MPSALWGLFVCSSLSVSELELVNFFVNYLYMAFSHFSFVCLVLCPSFSRRVSYIKGSGPFPVVCAADIFLQFVSYLLFCLGYHFVLFRFTLQTFLFLCSQIHQFLFHYFWVWSHREKISLYQWLTHVFF